MHLLLVVIIVNIMFINIVSRYYFLVVCVTDYLLFVHAYALAQAGKYSCVYHSGNFRITLLFAYNCTISIFYYVHRMKLEACK